MHTPEIYRTILLFFAVAGVAIPLFSKLKVSPVLGFLIIGALLGPFGIGRYESLHPIIQWLTFHQTENNEAIAEFGVVFLMFTIGLELSWERLHALRRLVFGAGGLQVVLSALAIMGLSFLINHQISSSTVIGAALALSSTAIALPLLSEQKRLAYAEGRLSFSILLFQDLSVAPILFVVGLMNAPASGDITTFFFIVIGQATVAIGILVILGRWPLRSLFRLVAKLNSDDLFMAACLFVVVATSLITALFGLSMALGAFLGGLLLAETEFRRAIIAVIEPFKGLLLGLFFTTVGMKINLQSLLEYPILIIGSAIALYLVKGAIITLIAKLYDFSWQEGIKTGALLGSGSEFAFVVIGIATPHLIKNEAASLLTMIVAFSMAFLPLLGRFLSLLDKKDVSISIAAGEEREEDTPELNQEKVIIVGYGYVGKSVSDMLSKYSVSYLIVDINPQRVETGRSEGKNIFFGDASKHSFLEACGIDDVEELVITSNLPGAAETIASMARRMHPGLKIIARARDIEHARRLKKLGVTKVVLELPEISLTMSDILLRDMNVPAEIVTSAIDKRREDYLALLNPLTENSD